MPVVYDDTTKNERMTVVKNRIDDGVDTGAAYMQVCTAGYAAVLAVFPMGDPSSSVSGVVLSFLNLPKTAVAIGSGDAALARIYNSDGSLRVSGLTVGVGTGVDIVISPSVAITAGQDVDWIAGTITHG